MKETNSRCGVNQTTHMPVRIPILGLDEFFKMAKYGIACSFGFYLLLATATISSAQNEVEAPIKKLVQFSTVEAGVYRVSYEDLLDNGIDLAGLKHRRFGLVSNDLQVAIRTAGALGDSRRSKLFGPGGYIEFYANKADNLYTKHKAFTLNYDSERTRIPKIKRKEHKVQRKLLAALAANGASRYQQRISIEQNNYYDFLSPSATDPWHFAQVTARGSESVMGTVLQFELPQLAGNYAKLEVGLYGLTDLNRNGDDHSVAVSLNALQVALEQFDGQNEYTAVIDDAPIYTGSNDISFSLQAAEGAAVSSVGLNKVTITYPRFAVASDGYLEGAFDDEYLVIDGFEENEVLNAYRRDTSGSLVYLRGLSRAGSMAMLQTNGVPAQYIIVADRALCKPTIMPISINSGITVGEAEYLIISHANFIGPELKRLVQLREQQYSVKVVDVEQIYAQFGDQLPDANAIHEYIRVAAEQLGTRFVVLIGADSYDYKHYQSNPSQVTSYLPTLYRGAQGGALFSNHVQTDAAYGDLDSDNIPEIPVGRFPVRTEQELATMINKLEKFESSSPFTFSTLIADTGFTADAEGWIDSLPDGSRIKGQMQNVNWHLFRAYVDDDGAFDAHADIIQTLNLGVVAVNYFGHGSMSQLGSTMPPLLSVGDGSLLTNTESPFVMMQWGSWTGSFANPDIDNLMYRLLVSSDAAAASLTGLSTISSRVNVNRLNRELSQRLYQQGATLGEAVVRAKSALAKNFTDDVSDVLLGMQILGDPALVVNWWPN